MFEFILTGIGEISKEYQVFNTKVYYATQVGLMAVGSELTKQLQKHIQTEVYDAYTPQEYLRRIDYGGGVPIISAQNMDMEIKGLSLVFNYEPSGKNANYPTSKYVNGDKLINAIENSDYSWAGTDNIPKRPFWNSFVDEMVGAKGQAETILVKGMNQAQPDLQVKSDGKIESDGNDTIFNQQLGFDMSPNDIGLLDD